MNYFKSFPETICVYREAACDAIIYGSLRLGLERIELGPNSRAENVRLSVKDFAGKLSTLKVHIYPTTETG
jgi:hypothetical protein